MKISAQMTNKMSLLNLEAGFTTDHYSGIIATEIRWLFNNSIPMEILFIPHAYDGMDMGLYIQQVRQFFSAMGISIKIITEGDPVKLIKSSQCIVAGGGSLEKLLQGIGSYKSVLKAALQAKIPFIGWNEGAVMACPSYVVPDPIAGHPECLGATHYQFFVNFTETTYTLNKMKSFLTVHQSSDPHIEQILALKDKSGGTGIRLEDDNLGIDFAGGTTIDPTTRYRLSDLEALSPQV